MSALHDLKMRLTCPVLLMLVVLCAWPAIGVASQVDSPPKRVVVAKPIDRDSPRAVFSKPAPDTLAELQIIETRVQDLVKKLTPCTVSVQVGPLQGSGVIVSKDGYVLTVAHVADAPGRSAVIRLADGTRLKGETLGMNHRRDAAMVKITQEGDWPFADLGDAKKVNVGDWCLAIGHPGGFREGRTRVVRLGRVIMNRDAIIQTDCTLVAGDSGGPLFDMQGRVIGTHAQIGVEASWNFHVPVSEYVDGWDRMVDSEAWGKFSLRRGGALLGVSGDDHPQGCRITRVYSEMPAEKVGLQIGDVIAKFDGTPIKGFDDLAFNVGKKSPGNKVTIEVWRDGETIRLTVVLTSRK